MWWYLIPALTALLSLVVIAGVLARALPRLIVIDISTIAEERNAARKRQIIQDRAERLRASLLQSIKRALRPRWKALRERVERWHARAVELEKRYRTIGASPQNAVEQARALVEEGVAFVERGELRLAEDRFLKAIRQAPRYGRAYEELGRLFVRGKQWQEAREAFRFLFKLDPNDASAHANMGELEVAHGMPMEAIQHFEKAVKLKPANPRLVALLLDAAITAQAKELALRTFARLKELAPQFPRLPEFEERIRRM